MALILLNDMEWILDEHMDDEMDLVWGAEVGAVVGARRVDGFAGIGRRQPGAIVDR